MTRSNKKADRGDHIDRISDLPSNVIDCILEHLPIIDVVRTSILSRKWRYTWVSVPQLEFKEGFFKKFKRIEGPAICNIITEVILLHSGPVYKFTLHIPLDCTIKIECLSKWILFLSRSGIKELELVNRGPGSYRIPSNVFSCQELTYFELRSFRLLVPPNFCGFKSLLELHLYYVRFESGALDSLVSGCPSLEELSISYCWGFECVDISVPALNVLRIDSTQIIKSICLKRAKNLTDLTLMASTCNVEGGKVSDLIKGLPKIQSLVMGSGYNRMLSAGTIPLTLRRSFSCLEYLNLNTVDLNEKGEFLFIVSLLRSAPNLVDLDIKSPKYGAPVPDHPEELECDSCCLSQLETVNIRVGHTFKYAMSLIRFILANSSSLKTLTFEVGLGSRQMDPPKLLSISRDLLRMERASQRAEVKFNYNDLVQN